MRLNERGGRIDHCEARLDAWTNGKCTASVQDKLDKYSTEALTKADFRLQTLDAAWSNLRQKCHNELNRL